jgi:hypothetical protein
VCLCGCLPSILAGGRQATCKPAFGAHCVMGMHLHLLIINSLWMSMCFALHCAGGRQGGSDSELRNLLFSALRFLGIPFHVLIVGVTPKHPSGLCACVAVWLCGCPHCRRVARHC